MVLINKDFVRLAFFVLLTIPIAAFAQNEESVTKAKEYFKKGKYAQSDSLYAKALALTLQNFGQDSPQHIDVLNDYIELCISYDKIADLRTQIDKVLESRANSNGKKSIEYARILYCLGDYLANTFNFAQAQEVFSEVLRIRGELLGENSSLYAKTLSSLAGVYCARQSLAQAEECYLKASQIASRIPDRELKAEIDINTAMLYCYTGRVSKGLELFPEALNTYREYVGELHPNYVTPFSNYASAYILSGNYAKAEVLLIKALELVDKALGQDHRQYLITLKALANVYITKGRYEQTEELLLKAVDISRRLYGEDSPLLASNLSLLSTTYMYLGNYAHAEKMMNQSIGILSKSPDAFKQSKAGSFNSLGVIYLRQKRFDDALDMFRKALDTQKEYNLLDNFLSLAISNNICTAMLSSNNKDFASIERDLLTIVEKHCSRSSATPAYLSQLTNLSALYRTIGQYDKAIYRAKEAIEGYEKGLDTMNWQFINLLQHYAQTLELTEDSAASLEIYARCLDMIKRLAARDFLFLTEQERELYWSAYNANLKEYLAFVTTSDDISTGFGYDCELFAKNLLLNSQRAIQNSILQSNDANLLTQWREIQAKYHTKEEERALLAMIKKQGNTNLLSMSWQQVQKMLGRGEAAIEIFNAPAKVDGEIRYYAFILTPLFKEPVLVSLCSQVQIQDALQNNSKEELLKKLYELAWLPIELHLKQISKIYIAPSGLFNSICFDAMQNENGYLSEQYQIHRLLSTGNIEVLKARMQNKDTKPSLALFGGVDYSTSPIRSDRERMRGQGFDYLPGSLREVLKIKTIAEHTKWEVSLFTGINASETQLKSYSENSPKIIHISTHGFYIPFQQSDSLRQNSNPFETYQDPMMRSGLLFSGANKTWTGNTSSDKIQDDGILTAAEIANLDLANTQLVVLSACDTGLGEIDYSEGIYGLQRAFRLAGVQAMVVSLWKVPDKETARIMSAFYNYLTKNFSYKQAFDAAKADARKRNPNEPHLWAGLVLVE